MDEFDAAVALFVAPVESFFVHEFDEVGHQIPPFLLAVSMTLVAKWWNVAPV